ncbi:hypothetical protein B9P99_00580 [Candidatus Marsarchaeota G1 archaeon OSP_B]|uniref:Cas12f1-like TNB domain-containing protein n=2 Tax=Candidatus Marsarchaeota group 1 TaxID=2203770 RepID=A0A2R6ARI3_9ARCH|nr:MAG: hypothetical protein B9Q00_03290 [Candidatus Marsarchaeota G1 archaeon OSP_C]PSN96060.1 MAG: hypothetical protein B9P99_00580 [Candidatus Marsarchaeota G1 archaeon OSP_B]
MLGVTLQTWGSTRTGVRPISARGFKRSGSDPERRDKEEEASTLRLLFLGVEKDLRVFRKGGKLVLPVPSYNSSRECFLCGGINQNLTLEDRIFNCAHCGFTLDRDLNF